MLAKIMFFFFLPLTLVCSEQAPYLKHQISICALFTNEAKYLKEWIEYHQLIGVDHFYLYDNNSKDRFRAILNPYIKKGVVTLISWPDYFENRSGENEVKWIFSTMTSAYEHAIRYLAVGETKWLTILNVNEFLVPLNEENLKELLARYEDEAAVILPTNYYDASKNPQSSHIKLIIESSVFSAPPAGAMIKTVEKTIFKPTLCTSFTWPPIQYKFKNQQQPKILSPFEAKVNGYRNRGFTSYRIHPQKLDIDPRRIPEEELKDILQKGFEVEDQEKRIYRFLPKLRQKLGHSPEIN